MVLLLCSALLLTATSVPHVLWLSSRMALLLLIVLLSIREWNRRRKSKTSDSTSKTSTSPAMIESSKPSATNTAWTLRSLIDRRRAKRVSDEERRGREVMEGMKRHIPRWRGWARYFPILFSGLFGGLVVFALMRPSRDIVTYNAANDPKDVIQVVQEYTPYNWKFHRLGDPPHVNFDGHICETYRPLFSAGMALKWFRYRDKGPCWDIQPRGFGYHIVREGDIPVLAPNCRALTDRIECTNNRADFQGVTYDAKLLLWQ
jgi:hypothetical protein